MKRIIFEPKKVVKKGWIVIMRTPDGIEYPNPCLYFLNPLRPGGQVSSSSINHVAIASLEVTYEVEEA
jgi:hypothetical protein